MFLRAAARRHRRPPFRRALFSTAVTRAGLTALLEDVARGATAPHDAVRQIAAVYDTLYPKMHSRVMDMTCLDLASASCEVILDKGSIDALMCTGSTPDGAWTSLGEFHRVLVPGGLYLIITGQSRTASFLSQQKHLERWSHQQSELDLGVGRRPVKFIVMRKK